MRAGILGFLHESNTFLNTPTTFADFERTSMTEGSELIERWTGAHHEIGGFLAGGLEAVPGFATFAVPSGTVTAEAFEAIAARLIGSALAMQVDGFLVALHGATVAENFPDADGEILRRLREAVKAPIVVTLDLHANVSATMVEHATAIVGYRTNPHLDQRERGIEAARLLQRIVAGGVNPVQALVTPPLAVPIAAQKSRELFLFEDLAQVLMWPGVLSATVFVGFYYADVAEMGTSFYVVADGDPELANRAARYLADRAWTRRHELVPKLLSPNEAVTYARESARKPVALMDIGDNVGGGSSARSRVLFDECVRQGARGVMVILHEPELVCECVRVGVRNEVDLGFARGVVKTIGDGRFTETRVRHGGWTHGDQGVSAVIETAEDHTIVLTSHRMAPMSLEQVVSLGVHPERKRILIVKGVIAPQAAYAEVAGEIVLVDTPGPTANDPRSFVYRNRRVPMFPMEPECEF
jgi:microcystin degradation protein MlrC